MRKKFLCVIFLFMLSPFTRADLSGGGNSDQAFLRSCRNLCSLFREARSSDLKDVLARLSQGPPSPSQTLQTRALSSLIAALESETFNAELVESAIISYALAGAHGRQAFPATNLSALQTAAIRQYTGNDYKELNAVLRRSDAVSSDVVAYRDYLNRALDRLPHYVGMVIRGVSPFEGWAEIYKPGQTVTELAFTSTSTSPSGGYNLPLTFVIRSLTGADISSLSANVGEREVLFKAGSRFRVESVNRVGARSGKNQEFRIELTELP
jgi:NAD:arginine ADP-ribosyltransferase